MQGLEAANELIVRVARRLEEALRPPATGVRFRVRIVGRGLPHGRCRTRHAAPQPAPAEHLAGLAHTMLQTLAATRRATTRPTCDISAGTHSPATSRREQLRSARTWPPHRPRRRGLRDVFAGAAGTRAAGSSSSRSCAGRSNGEIAPSSRASRSTTTNSGCRVSCAPRESRAGQVDAADHRDR